VALVVSIAAVLPLGDPYSGAEQGGREADACVVRLCRAAGVVGCSVRL